MGLCEYSLADGAVERQRGLTMPPIAPEALAVIRLCERPDCTFAVNNAIQELKKTYFKQGLTTSFPCIQGQEAVRGGGGRGGGGANSNAAIPALEEECDEIRWSAWCARF